MVDTSQTDFVSELYRPLLRRSVRYKRGVGYFTSGWLKQNATGLAELAKNGGTAQIITSPELTDSDWDAIQEGTAAQSEDILRERLRVKVADLETSLEHDTRNALGWLVADGVLEFRFAIPDNELDGDFHDKWAIFESEAGEKVAVHGSQNDSEKGFRNYESYDVFAQWTGSRDAARVTRHEERFDRIWDGNDPNVATYTIPDAVLNDLLSLRTTSERPYELGQPDDAGIELREYQQEAVDAWFANRKRGLFQMATGTGKTYTAIGALDRLLQNRTTPMLTVISVPYTHLARQWEESLAEWGYTSVTHVYGTANRTWKQDLSRRIDDLSIGVREQEITITTHTSMSTEYFRGAISDAACETLLIADEVHGLGSGERRKGLTDSYDFRLGLSATPERQYDESGTKFLLDFFDGVVYEYPLEDAIPEYLVPYNYYPLIVELTEDELDAYRGLSRKLATEFSKDDPDKELIERLLLKRARMVKSAENKLPTLRRILRGLPEHERDHLLVYTNPQQFESVQDVLHEVGLVQHQFTAEEDQDARETLLEGFAEGRYDALVAMKCLDEGVDVPSTERAILMSNSNNKMQFVQRRGRVLRRADELGKDHADIYDIIVVPSENPDRQLINSEKKLLEKELRRFEEFARLAKNDIEARNQIEPLRTQYEI